jgi:predicted secreted hydrolase
VSRARFARRRFLALSLAALARPACAQIPVQTQPPKSAPSPRGPQPPGATQQTAGAEASPGTPPTNAGAAPFAPVVPGRALRFPDDEGSHPDFRIEWWYVTGWLKDDTGKLSGFQVTFFRTRPTDTGANPSRFAPAQLIIAHAALADPQRERLLHEERAARAVLGLAGAAELRTDVVLRDWRLARGDTGLRATIPGRELGLDLTFAETTAPLLHGESGFSRKGPGALSASWYYTLPHLRVSGSVRTKDGTARVTGSAWLDHEWSSAPLEEPASGWDWIGINLDDGGALMVYRIRSATRANYWSGATLRRPDGSTRIFSAQQVAWIPLREWRSSRTGASYPVAWNVRVDELVLQIEPLMDDQELDARLTTGTVYWEGAVTLQLERREIGRGYLEMTGYWRAFRP